MIRRTLRILFATRLRRATVIMALLPILGWASFRGLVRWWPYPPGIDRPPAAGTSFQDRTGVPLAAFVGIDGQWQLPLSRDEISPHLLAAIVAVEDGRFAEHHGVDWKSVAGSLVEDVRHLGVRRGGSTLTMQLQRLRDPRPRTLLNKLEQAVRAEQIERTTSKADVLAEYLNRAPFGGNLVGAGAASWRYFGRPCRDLSLAQAALLAGLPQSPNRLRPDRHAASAKARRDHVLDRMLATGVITEKQRTEALAEPVDATWRPLPQEVNRGLLPALQKLSADFTGRSVALSIDATIQSNAVRVLGDGLAKVRASGIAAGALVVADTQSGECLAAVSIGGGDGDLTRAARSTGSTLKPLIYAAAFDAGFCTPRKTLDDSPAAWPGYVPGNYDGVFRGPMPAADALAESRNIPALLVLQGVGVNRAVGLMQAFGLQTLAAGHREYGLSLAIGGAEASPWELAEAYAALGRGGTWKPLTMAPASPAARRVMRAEACWQVLNALSTDDRTRGVSPEAVGSHVAWKTGTSSGHRDAWCAAVTRRRTVVVWLGNPTGEGAASLVGAEAAAPLALRLIAALDPTEDAWPADNAGPSQSPALVASHRLVMASPQRGQKFVLFDELPAERQRVRLEASADGWWFIDDSPAGEGRQTWWSPTPGTHRVRVIDAEGRSASADIDVRGSASRDR